MSWRSTKSAFVVAMSARVNVFVILLKFSEIWIFFRCGIFVFDRIMRLRYRICYRVCCFKVMRHSQFITLDWCVYSFTFCCIWCHIHILFWWGYTVWADDFFLVYSPGSASPFTMITAAISTYRVIHSLCLNDIFSFWLLLFRNFGKFITPWLILEITGILVLSNLV